MPELAEVYFYAHQWTPALGDKIIRLHSHPQTRLYRDCPATALEVLKNRHLTSIQTHGKQMAFGFDDDHWLVLHLGMAGKLYAGPPEWAPGKHDHLILFSDQHALVFSDYRQFGKVQIGQQKMGPPQWNDAPPPPHLSAFDFTHFSKILRASPRRCLKGLLLDQGAFPGVGNWMADEILWRARLHPSATPASLSPSQRKTLHAIVREVCLDALRVIGSDWGDPPPSWLFPHRWKKGGICPVSGKPLHYETIAGRTTCFSPALQKERRSASTKST